MIAAGNIVTFDVTDSSGTKRYEGTTLTDEVNGLVLVAVHDTFLPAGNGWVLDKNILPVMAVRAGYIIDVNHMMTPRKDNIVGHVMTNFQGKKR